MYGILYEIMSIPLLIGLFCLFRCKMNSLMLKFHLFKATFCIFYDFTEISVLIIHIRSKVFSFLDFFFWQCYWLSFDLFKHDN